MKTHLVASSARPFTAGSKRSKKPQTQRALAGSVGALLTCALLPSAAHGAAWTWLSSGNASGTWSTSTNWDGGVPNATDAIADFSTLNLTADSTVTVDALVTTGTMLFGDTTPSNNWIVSGSAITLATSGANAPLIQVNNQTVTFNTALAGTQGFIKNGAGTLVLAGSNSYSGGTTISGGTLQFSGSSAMPGATAITLNSPGTLDLGGTSRTTTGLVTLNGGTLQNGVLTSNNAGEANNNQFSGTVTLGSGGAFVTNQRLLMANGGSDTLTIAPGSTGTMTFGGDNGSGENYVAVGGGAATLNINGGTVNFTNSSNGTNNGYLNVASNSSASNGTVAINGGNLNVGTWMKLGGNYSSNAGTSATSALSISNGAVKVGGGSDATNNGVLFMNGGNGDNTASTGTSTLTVGTSGTLTVTQIQAGNGGTKTINLNGGAIVAAAGAASTFIPAATGLSVNIQSGGATINTGTSSITVAAPLSGTGALMQIGSGTLLLTATNSSLTGPISVNAGTLAGGASNVNTFGGITGAITVAAGAGFGFNNIAIFNASSYANNLFLSGTGSSTAFGALELGGNVATSGTITLNTDARITHNWNTATVTGPITGSNTSLTLSTFQASQYGFSMNGNISLGTGALIVNGIGTAGSPDVTLSGSNSYSGGTNLNGGTLSIASENAISGSTSALTFNGGILQVTGVALTNLNSHTVNWSTFSGGFDVNNAANTFTVSQALSGTGTLNKLGAGKLLLSGTNSLSGAVTVSAGTLVLNGANNFSGGVTVNAASTLALGNATALGSTLLTDNGSLDLGGYSPTFASLTGTGSAGNNSGAGLSTLTLGGTAAATFSGVLKDNLGTAGGTLAVTKSGVNTQTLSGVNTYTGATLVNGVLAFGSMVGAASSGGPTSAGTLQVSGLVANTASLTIVNGGTVIDGNSTAASNNGIVNRINSAATLTMGGANGGGTFTMAAPAASNTTSQAFAALAVGPGFNNIASTANTTTSGTTTLTFTGAGGAGYTPSSGGMVNFASGIDSTSGSVTLVTGSNVVTMASTAGVQVGQPITGTGMPTNEIVTAILSGTSLTLSQAATASGAQSLTYYVAANTQNVAFGNAPTAAGGSAVSGTPGSGNEILVGAFLNGIDFVSATSGTLTPATYTANTASALTVGANINVTGQSTAGLTGLQQINSLRFADGVQRTVALTSGTLQIASGGIIFGPGNQRNATTSLLSGITGGALTSGTNALFISSGNGVDPRNNYGALISSKIVDNGAPVSLVFSNNGYGNGMVALSNTSNTFTGNVYLNNGFVALQNGDGVLGGSNSVIVNGPGNLIRTEFGTWSANHNLVINSGGYLSLGAYVANLTFNGQLSGGGVFGATSGFYNGGAGVILPGSQSGFTGTYLVGVWLQADDGVGLSPNANLALAANDANNGASGVLETKANFYRSLGSGP